MPPFLIEPLG
ncbi:uncharacterized protein FFM5_10422 [Fusarium fujikuroi]|nr:uncharacterized protein FFM5_10422 [Fusarium fujikuroi]